MKKKNFVKYKENVMLHIQLYFRMVFLSFYHNNTDRQLHFMQCKINEINIIIDKIVPCITLKFYGTTVFDTVKQIPICS